MRWLLKAVEVLDLVDGVKRWREASMNAQHRVIDDGREAEAVEDVDARLPHGGVAVLFEALVIEAVNLRDLAALMVSTDEGDPFGVADLCGADGLGVGAGEG